MDEFQKHWQKFQEQARELLGLETSLKAINGSKKQEQYNYQDAFCHTVASFARLAADFWYIQELLKPENNYSQADKDYKIQSLENSLMSYANKIDALTWLASYEKEMNLYYKEPCKLANRVLKTIRAMQYDFRYIKEKLAAPVAQQDRAGAS